MKSHAAMCCGEEGGRRPRPRGRRQRGEGESEIVLTNSSGLPQLMDVVHRAAVRKGKVAAIINQGHHKGKLQVIDIQAKSRGEHWRSAVAPAVEGAGVGNSAWVAVLALAHVGCGRTKVTCGMAAEGGSVRRRDLGIFAHM